MGTKKFFCGYAGFVAGGVLGTVLALLLIYFSSSFFLFGLIIAAVGVVVEILVVHVVLKWRGSKGADAKRITSLVDALAVPFFFIILVLTWLAIPSPPLQSNHVVTGFIKMQPLTPSITYHGTNFSAGFTNALGTTVRLTNATVTETVTQQPCNIVVITYSRNGTVVYDLVNGPDGLVVKAGGIFILSGECPRKAGGEIYDLLTVIQYNATIVGIEAMHTDVGHIKGQGEKP